MTQVMVALCVYLTLAYLKFQARTGQSLQQMSRLIHLNLFAKTRLDTVIQTATGSRNDFTSGGVVMMIENKWDSSEPDPIDSIMAVLAVSFFTLLLN